MSSNNWIAGLSSALILAMSAAGAAAEVRPMGNLGAVAPSKAMVTTVAQKAHGGGGQMSGPRMTGPKMSGPRIGAVNRGLRPGGMVNRNIGNHGPAPFVNQGNSNWKNYARFSKGPGHPRPPIGGHGHRRHGPSYGYGYGFPVYSYGYYADDDDDECFWSRRRGRWVCPDEE
jgi:hypothetical protein